MKKSSIILFTRNGLGEGPGELQALLAVKFLGLLFQSNQYPGKIIFYTDGVRLVCEGSPVLEWLKLLEGKGLELIICSTCLETFGLTDKVRVGRVGGMPDILAAMQAADQVISL
jgi:sulfur relay (sulfurtransferase) complex TusBCD TusD component (DsrE family)